MKKSAWFVLVLIVATGLAAGVWKGGRNMMDVVREMHGAHEVRSLAQAVHGKPHAVAPAAAKDGSPAAVLEHLARGWVAAFPSDDAMREFIAKNFAEESLSERDVETRIGGVHSLRERFGTLSAGPVVSSDPGELHIKLIAADTSEHEFIFRARTAPPVKLKSIAFLDVRHHP